MTQEEKAKAKAYDKAVKEASIAYKDGDKYLKATLERIFPDPKFHEGEWVVYNHDICQIVKREEGCNKLVTVFGIEKELVNERNLSTAHLWTIQDAKAGDVLACGEEISLFKSYSVQGRISLYCWYNGQTNNFHNKEVVDILLTTRNKVCPATKEQRDLLFSKMKEAGYEWDAEKKKLKKIDDEEVNGEDYGIDGLWHAKRILEKTLGSVSGYQTDDGILDHKAAITAVKKLYEQKPTWTEEDGKKLSDILVILSGGENCYYNSPILIDWLKSLKERIGGYKDKIMTQEDKNLLLKDLSSRLPYGVILNCCNIVGEKLYTIDSNGLVNEDYDLEEVKPYLFPLSSMTKEQKREYNRLKHKVLVCHYEYGDVVEEVELFDSPESFEYLIENHFDYHGLIEKGLAIDATGLNIY